MNGFGRDSTASTASGKSHNVKLDLLKTFVPMTIRLPELKNLMRCLFALQWILLLFSLNFKKAKPLGNKTIF